MGALQPIHLLLIAAAVLLVFGPRKLPELARGIGESMKELKLGLQSTDNAEEAAFHLPEHAPASAKTGDLARPERSG